MALKLNLGLIGVTALLFIGCKTTFSDLSNNGRVDEQGEAAYALRLNMVTAKDEHGGTCTAQLIEKNMILTAAHCVYSLDMPSETIYSPDGKDFVRIESRLVTIEEKDIKVYFNGENIGKVGKITVHPEWLRIHREAFDKYSKTPSNLGFNRFDALSEENSRIEQGISEVTPQGRPYDLALLELVRLPEHVETAVPIVKIATQSASSAQEVLIAGYGRQTLNGVVDFKRRVGENVISKVDRKGFYEIVTEDLNDSKHIMIFPGDSGSMLYDKKSKLGLGICSMVSESGSQQYTGTFTSLQTEASRSFICPKVPAACAPQEEARTPEPAQKGTYIPKCMQNGKTYADYSLTFQRTNDPRNDSKFAYMKSSKGGFSCKKDAGIDQGELLPACQVVCPQQEQKYMGNWGWCQADGFSCVE